MCTSIYNDETLYNIHCDTNLIADVLVYKRTKSLLQIQLLTLNLLTLTMYMRQIRVMANICILLW